MSVEAVLFDIGNVLLHWNPEGFYDRRIGAARRRALFAEVGLEAMNVSVDLGAPFAVSVEALAAAHPGWRAEILLWRDHWIEMATPAIPHSVHLLRRLRAKGVPVHALSNFGVETFEIATESHEFLTEFDGLFLSGRMRLAKPDPAIYAAVEVALGLQGAALLFADDRPENIAACEARGWKGHLFDGPQGWADRLVAEGLLAEAEVRL